MYERKQNAAGNDVVIVEASDSKLYEPSHIRVVEIEKDSQYTRINGKNVISSLGDFRYNPWNGRGKDTAEYAVALASAKNCFEKATAVNTIAVATVWEDEKVDENER